MDIFVIIAIVVIIFFSLSSVPTPMVNWEIEELIEKDKKLTQRKKNKK